MPKPIPDPHDSFFRETFSRRDVAEDFLREYLPPAIVQAIDWTSLEIAKDSFVEKALRKHYSDLVYNVRHGERRIKIYLLVEHKSRPDPWVSLQLLRYQVRIWELHRKQHPREPLPPILPLVLYHGRQRWHTPDHFHALFGALAPELAPHVPEFRHELCDLSLPEPEQIRGQLLSRVVLLALKYIFEPDQKRRLVEIVSLAWKILQRDTSLEMLEVILRYYVQAHGALDETDIREILIEAAHEEDPMQTFIDRYIEQGHQQGLFKGRQEGLQEGLQKGLQKGRKETQRDIARSLLDLIADDTLLAARTGLPVKEIVEMRREMQKF